MVRLRVQGYDPEALQIRYAVHAEEYPFLFFAESSMVAGDKDLSKGFIDMEGTVDEVLPSATFKVTLANGHQILAYLSGKMRMNKIRLIPGDRVRLEISPYDLTKGRIVYRM